MEPKDASLQATDRVRTLLPWLHECAWSHPHTLERIDAIAANADHREALRTAYRVRIELVEKSIMDLYDEIAGTRMKADAAIDVARSAAIADLVK